jgi:GH25 family lysozyme M1 (1,4-beta-N-acetylmuramidase)
MPRVSVAAAALLLAVVIGLARAEQLQAALVQPRASEPNAPAADGYLEGLDVSHWQNTIDWSQVAASGRQFAMIKVTEGETFLDNAYAANIAGARAAGIRATAYHFAQPGLPKEEANIQADWYVQNARLRAGDLVPALDLEVRNGLAVADLQAWVLTWLQRVEARIGVKPMIYVSPSFWRNYMGDTTVFADQGYTVLWIAHWGVTSPSVPASNWGGRGWTFWQYSNCGSVPGISGCVDLDRYNGLDLSPVLYGPGRPTGVTGAPGNRQVTVSWTPAASSSGGPITAYTVTAAPGGATCTTSGATSCTVGGLTNGSPYTFTVTGTNASGTGLPSSPSASVTPRTVPDAPTGVGAAPGNASAAVSWTAPAWNGGAAITGYTATASPGGASCATSGATTCTVSGLANGTAYTFTVAASNAAGTGAASSPSPSVTPRTVPNAPTGVTATAGDAFALVAWSAPSWNGGAAITGYAVTASPGGRTCSTTSALSCEVSGLTNGTAYTFTVRASNVAGSSAPSTPSAPVTPWPPTPSSYVTLAPARILDTRYAIGLSGALSARVARTFQVAGHGGVPAGASGVTGNLTVTGQTAGGWLTIGPAAGSLGGFSTVNFPVGDTRANGVTVSLGPGGSLSVLYDGAPSGASANAIFDVTGYFLPGTSGSTYVTLTPNRVLDSRYANGLSGAFQGGVPRTFQVTNRSADPALNIPSTAVAVTGNLTVTQQSSPGWLSVTPTATSNPSTSTLNFPVGDNRANNVTAPLGTGGSLSIVYSGVASSATTHVIFDVTGYFVPGTSGALYVPLLPSRLLDSRYGNGLSGPFQTGVARAFGVVNRAVGDAGRNVPANAVAATGNLTVTGQTRPGWLTMTPFLDDQPPTSTLNFPVGDDRANGVTVAIGGGSLSVVYNGATSGDRTQAIFDVTGYFVPAS